VIPRLLWPSWRWITVNGTPSCAISTACACRSWCGAMRRLTPAAAAVRRSSPRGLPALPQSAGRRGTQLRRRAAADALPLSVDRVARLPSRHRRAGDPRPRSSPAQTSSTNREQARSGPSDRVLGRGVPLRSQRGLGLRAERLHGAAHLLLLRARPAAATGQSPRDTESSGSSSLTSTGQRLR
jgi:hypothetical protein